MSLYSCQIAKDAREDLGDQLPLCHGKIEHSSPSPHPSPHPLGHHVKHLPKLPEEGFQIPGNRHSHHLYGRDKQENNGVYYKVHGEHPQQYLKAHSHAKQYKYGKQVKDPYFKVKVLVDDKNDVINEIKDWIQFTESCEKGEKNLSEKDWITHRKNASKWLRYIEQLAGDCQQILQEKDKQINNSIEHKQEINHKGEVKSTQTIHHPVDQNKLKDSHLFKLPKMVQQKSVQELQAEIRLLQEQLHNQRQKSELTHTKVKQLSMSVVKHQQLLRKYQFKHKEMQRIIKSLINQSEQFLQKVLTDVNKGSKLTEYPQLIRTNMKHLRQYKDLDLELKF